MARRTVRVDLPINSPDDMIKLGGDISKHHEKLATASPLKPTAVSKIADRVARADEKRRKADELEAEAAVLRDAADTLIGIAPGQSIETPDTLYREITGVRDALLVEYRGAEETLSQFGFKVVIGTAASRGRAADGEEEEAEKDEKE